ncbi:MAG: hemerythrin family protein [Gammaproteobacteria bacterium]|jgi:hemerythrin
MPLFDWDDAYLIGVDELDFEHKDLFARLNELHGELMRHDNKEETLACLGEIHARVMAHFALEERYMQESKDPHFAQHKQEHDAFLEVIVDIIEKFRNDPGFSYADSLERQLQVWIIDHIQTSDRTMA